MDQRMVSLAPIRLTNTQLWFFICSTGFGTEVKYLEREEGRNRSNSAENPCSNFPENLTYTLLSLIIRMIRNLVYSPGRDLLVYINSGRYSL